MPVRSLKLRKVVASSTAANDYMSAVASNYPRAALPGQTFGQLLSVARLIKSKVQGTLSAASQSDNEPRIGVLAAPGAEYVSGTWGSWLAGGVVVPLATSHPPRELEYVIKDAGVSMVLAPNEQLSKVEEVARQAGIPSWGIPTQTAAAAVAADESRQPAIEGMPDDHGALIMYTSGTTGKPKGVLHTHGSILSQVRSLVEAWEWESRDRILHALPLHHTHGIVNALYCPHYVGATVEFMPRFSPNLVWQRLMSGEVTVFMGVPTMYSLLLSAYDAMTPAEKARAQEAAAQLRLTVSGSAACPLPVMARWQALSGRPLLERYGMTEIGMALSNPYRGDRRPGYVGVPLPGVEAKIQPLPEEDQATSSSGSGGNGDTMIPAGVTGELLIRGSTLFKCYWNRPEATAEAFDEEGWFRTGDTASLGGSPPYYRIEGRTSVDIIKTSGYKVSALEIENVVLEHPEVSECAVVGVPDDMYGQLLAALVVRRSPAAEETAQQLDKPALQQWCRDRLPPYKVPKTVLFVEAIPRNAMGKVNKKELLKSFFSPAVAP